MDEKTKKSPPLFPKALQIAKVITPLKYKRDVVRVIEELGEVEPILVDPRTGIDQIQVEGRRNEVEALRTKLSSFLSSLKADLIIKGEKIVIDQSEDSVLNYIRDAANNKGKRIEEIIQRKEQISARTTELKNIVSLLERFRDLSIDSKAIGETSMTKTLLGTVYPPTIDRLLWTLDEITDSKYFYLEKEVVHLQETVILISVLKKDAETVIEKLKGMSYQEIAIPKDVDFDGLSISDCDDEAISLETESDALSKELDEIASDKGTIIKAALELCNIELQRISIELKMRRTETTCVLWAWIPEHLKEKLTTAMQSAANHTAEIDFRKGDFDPSSVPSYVENSEFMQPMRGVVSSFGTPSSTEVDPYPFVKFIMPLMFGIMFADFGHGLLFLLFGIWAKRKKDKMDEIPEGLMGYIYGGPELIIIMGATAMLLGIPFNSFFGDETFFWQFGFLRAIFENTTWAFFFIVENHGGVNSIERNYLNFLIFSFAVGAVIILLGLSINVYQLSKYRKHDSELQAAIALLTGYALIIIGAVVLSFSPLIFNILLGIALFSLFAMLVIEKRAHGIDGLMLGIDHILSLLSNTFSFGRLLAMNTVHFVLAFLPYLFIEKFGGVEGLLNHNVDVWTPKENVFIWIIAAAIGAAIVLVVEGTFSTLQALRLNWVEFFGKFFKGTGVEFRPVKVKRIYTVENLN